MGKKMTDSVKRLAEKIEALYGHGPLSNKRGELLGLLREAMEEANNEAVQEFVDAINEETECGHKLGWSDVRHGEQICEVCLAYARAAEVARKIKREFEENQKLCDATGNFHGGTSDIHGAMVCEEIAAAIEALAKGEKV